MGERVVGLVSLRQRWDDLGLRLEAEQINASRFWFRVYRDDVMRWGGTLSEDRVIGIYSANLAGTIDFSGRSDIDTFAEVVRRVYDLGPEIFERLTTTSRTDRGGPAGWASS